LGNGIFGGDEYEEGLKEDRDATRETMEKGGLKRLQLRTGTKISEKRQKKTKKWGIFLIIARGKNGKKGGL